MQAIMRARRRLRRRKGYLAVSRTTGAVAAADVSSKIHRLVEARERARTMVEQLKRRVAGADFDWTEAVANEIAATGSIESVMSKYKELKMSSGGTEEKIAAALFVLDGIEKLLAHHKKYHREMVIHHLKATASQLAQIREAHKRDRTRLAARLENLLLEIRELEPDALSGARLSEN